MKGILVSIITVCLDGELTIRKTLESVLEQAYPKIEYLVIDGGSRDRTVHILQGYAAKFEGRGIRYRIVSEPDKGIYDAMNKGIRLAQGELIGIINSSDWYEKEAVASAVNAYKRTRFDYYCADVRLIGRSGKKIVKHSRLARFATSRYWNHPASFVAADAYRKWGIFRCEGIHDDFDFYLRVRKACGKVVVENKVLANFTMGGASNAKSLKKCWKRCLDRYRCYRNNNYSRLYWMECIGIEFVKFIWN